MTAPAADYCAIGSRPHRSHDGMRVCAHHAQELATMLRAIENEAALLDPRKSMAVHDGGKGGGLAHHQVPVRIDVLVLTDRRRNTGRLGSPEEDPWGMDDTPEVLDVLGSWARLVREERSLTAPAGLATVATERSTLSVALSWIVEQGWVAELHSDLRGLLRALQRANGTLHNNRRGYCWVLRDGEPCGGHIERTEQWRTVWRRHSDRCTAETAQVDDGPLQCARCGEAWKGDVDEARATAILEQQRREQQRPHTADGRPMRTAAEMAARNGTTAAAVRQRASRLRIPARNNHYDPAALGWAEDAPNGAATA